MKTFTISGAGNLAVTSRSKKGKVVHDIVAQGDDTMSVSDGYHTMDDVYAHRVALWIAFCRMTCHVDEEFGNRPSAWRSKLHSDGTKFHGWFVLGMGEKKGDQVTYHLPMSKWQETDFAETLERAHPFDGHTSADVLERLKNL